jgi:hypothetical protein
VNPGSRHIRQAAVFDLEPQSVPLATLRSSVVTTQGRALVEDLAERYPRNSAVRVRHYMRIKTKTAYETATAAFLAELLSAHSSDRRNQWLACSLDKNRFSGQAVSSRMFDNVRKAWTKERLVQVKRHKSGRHPSDELAPSDWLTRYRATPKLLAICAEHGITPDNVTDHFQID